MSEIVASGIINAGILEDWIDTFTPLVNEGKVHFNDDGLTARVVDPGNIAMIRPGHLASEAFESYDSPGAVTVGVNFDRLNERLSAAGSSDLVEFEVDMEARMLSIGFRNIQHSVAMIDPDAIRKEPDDPDLDLPNTVTIQGAAFKEAVSNADMVSDHLEIHGNPSQREVVMRAQGDTDDVTVTFDRDDTTDPTEVVEDVESLYSLEYLTDMVKPIPKDAEVSLTFGNEYPVLIDYEAHEGMLEASQMLAPRIRSD